MKRFLSLRPACFVCLFFIASSFFTAAALVFLDFNYVKLLSAAAAVFILSVIVFIVLNHAIHGYAASKVIIFAVIAAMAGMMLSSWQFGIHADLIISDYSGEDRRVEFTVRRLISQTSYSSVYDIHITSVDGEASSVSAVLKITGSSELSAGDIASATGTVSENVGYGDTAIAKLSYAADARFLCLNISEQSDGNTENITVTGEYSSILSLPDRLRNHFSDVLKIRIEKKACGLPAAVLLGDKSGLSASVRRDFSEIGTAHLLAVSGTHLSVIIGSLDIIIGKLRIDRRVRNTAVSLAAFFFAALTGFSASALRAAAMLTLARIAPMFGRRSDSVTSLCTAVSAIIILDRSAAADIGLLLSFCSTLGIVTVGKRLGVLLKPICARIEGAGEKASVSFVRSALSGTVSYFGSIAIMSISATVVSLPVAAVFFGFPSASALAANLLLVPLITVLISVTPFALITGIFAPVGNIAAAVSTEISVLSVSAARFLSDIGNSSWYPAAAVSLIAAAAILTCVGIFRHRYADKHFRKKLVLTLAAAFAAIGITVSGVFARYICFGDGGMAVFISDGENDGLVISDGGTDILIDITDGSKAAAERNLSAVPDGVPEVIVLTHVHGNHVSAFGEILSGKRVKTLYLPLYHTVSERNDLNLLISAAEKAGTDVILYKEREQIEFGRAGLIMPSRRSVSESDTESAVMFGVMFDGEAAVEYISGALQKMNFIDDTPFMPEYAVIGAHGPASEASLYYHKAGIKTVVFASGYIKSRNPNAGDSGTSYIVLGEDCDRYIFELD